MPKATFANRQEFVRDGKTYHTTEIDGAGEVVHVGTWLLCDTCNPVQVVDAKDDLPDGTSTLVRLRTEYDEAKKAEKAAAERAKAATDKLKTALADATNNATRAALNVPGYKPLFLSYSEPWTVDTKALKAEQPLIYVQYAKQGTRWTLTEGKGE